MINFSFLYKLVSILIPLTEDNTKYNEDYIDKVMSEWLIRLGKSRKESTLPIIEL